MDDSVIFWPEHKVYLYGQVAFLKDVVEHKAMRKQEISRYFERTDRENNLEAELSSYVDAGYFKYNKPCGTDGETLYMITDIDQARFKNELCEYLKTIKNDLPLDDQQKVWQVAVQKYSVNGFRTVVRWKDIYGESTRQDYWPPFLEMIYDFVLTDKIQLSEISYTNILPYLWGKNYFEKMPRSMYPLYVRPFVKFEITDVGIQRSIKAGKAIPEHTAKLILLPGRRVQLSLDGKRHDIRKFTSIKNNTYKVFSNLYNSGNELTIDELGLNRGTGSNTKTLLENAGLDGIIGEVFLEKGRNGKKNTVKMIKFRNVNDDYFEKLSDFVNSISKKIA
jgi:hypothetical protein